jgi:hypothetical protein
MNQKAEKKLEKDAGERQAKKAKLSGGSQRDIERARTLGSGRQRNIQQKRNTLRSKRHEFETPADGSIL